MIEVFMPKAGMDMEEGRLIRWLKEVGDHVELDEPIMEIETDKITMEAESPGTGILLAKLVPEDTVVPVLQVIGYIGEPGEKVPEQAEAKPQESAPAPKEEATREAAPSAQAAAFGGEDVIATPYAKTLAKEKGVDLAAVIPSGRHGEIKGADVLGAAVKATPLAARMADDMGIDLARISGSGYAGKIVKEDVLANCAPQKEAQEELCVPLKGARKVIADRMSRSHTECPTVTQHMKIDVTRLLALRRELNENRESKISVNDFILKVVALAVSESPLARTVIRGDMLVTKPETNIGFAVGMDEGLLVPVIKNADMLTLSEISRQAKDMAARARTNAIKPDEMSGGTFTVSNMGMFDVYAFTPIINQPESGILGVSAIEDQVYVKEDGGIGVKKMLMISLTYDHRIMDGVGAAKLQLRIKGLMENPLDALC
ncbi:MAG: dihydrolipoamide acetyltransferase family protein [Christensenella sp.]|nr:dihydrolipoamide acetyltransferase family protein [Christensenella sp.]